MFAVPVFRLIILLVIIFNCVLSGLGILKGSPYDLSDHTVVTDSKVFPYIAAILKKSSYLCAGALIDESWVLTAADSLFLLRDSLKLLRVRLGSVNNRQGGMHLAVKLFEIHPYFEDRTPEFDVALIKLAKRIYFTPNLKPIRVQKTLQEPTATHFTVTSWPTLPPNFAKSRYLESIDVIKRRRLLTVAHLHPSEKQECSNQLEDFNITSKNLMCLDPTLGSNPCVRDNGAPVVLNGILWGIVSSWKPDDCDLDVTPSFVSLVAAANISTWIHATIHGKTWNKRRSWIDMIDYDDDYTEV